MLGMEGAMRSLFLVAALLALPSAASTWEIDPAHSVATFSVRHMMVSNVRGEFGKMSGVVQQDDKDITKSSVDVTVDTTTINTREPKRDAHLKSADFFEADKYPTMTFKSTRITKVDESHLKVAGNLTLHGVTKPAVFDAEITPETAAMGKTVRGVTATTKLNRKDFGLNWNKAIEAGGVLVGDDVAVNVEFELHKKAPSTAATK
jgi:polyisoprenoid-binding protein YceI